VVLHHEEAAYANQLKPLSKTPIFSYETQSKKNFESAAWHPAR
jgi:hypothetical protein